MSENTPAVVACRDCVHHRRLFPKPALCTHPKAKRSEEPRWDLGETEPRRGPIFRTCRLMRSELMWKTCGPDGHLFDLERGK